MSLIPNGTKVTDEHHSPAMRVPCMHAYDLGEICAGQIEVGVQIVTDPLAIMLSSS